MSVVLCTAGYDHTIRFWEALSGICSRTIPSPDSQVNRLCISPDKRYLAAAGHHLIKIYDIKSTNPQPIFTFDGHTNNVTGLAFHCDSKWLATSSEDGTVKIWDVRTANVQRNYNHGSPVNDVVIHPNQGELVSCDRSGTVRVWDLGENRCSHQLIPEEDVSVASVTLATDGSLLCAGNNLGRVFIWRMIQTNDITSLVPICKFSAHGTYITRVLLSPDTRHLATCSADHTARIWAIAPDLGDPSVPQPAKRPAIASTSVTGPGATIGGAKSNGQGAVAGKASKKAQDSDSDDSSAEESSEEEDDDDDDEDENDDEDDEDDDEDDSDPDTPSSAVKRIDLNKKKLSNNNNAFSASHLPSKALQGAFAKDGKDEPDIEQEADQPLPLEMTLQGHQRWVWDCAFSADSAYLVTACSDHYARLWELSTQSIIRQYNGHHRGAVCVALNDTAIN